MFNKKFTASFLALFLVCAMTLSFVACGGPQGKIVKAEDKEIENISANISNYYELADKNYEKYKNAEMNLKFRLGDSILTLLNAALQMDVGFLNNFSLTFGEQTKDKAMQLNFRLNYLEDPFLSLIVMLNLQSKSAYLALPELNDKYALVPLEEVDIPVTIPGNSNILEMLPKEEDVIATVQKYSGIIVDSYTEPSVSDEILKANGVEQECKAYVVEYNEEQLKTLCKTILTELKKDETVKRIVECELLKYAYQQAEYEEDIYTAFIEDIDEALEELENPETSDETSGTDTGNTAETVEERIVITTYIAKKSEIIGRKLEVVTEDGTGTVKAVKATAGDQIGCEFSFVTDDEDIPKILVAGKYTDDEGIYTGTSEITVDEDLMFTVDFSNFNNNKHEDEGILDGTFTVSVGEAFVEAIKESIPDEIKEMLLPMLANIQIKLTCSEVDKGVKADLAVVVSDVEQLALEITCKQTEKVEIKEPSADRVEADTDKWSEGLKIENLLNIVKESKLPEEVKNLILGLFQQ